jgi:hypothetical protein
MEGQKRPRAALVDERNREAGNLAALKAERASVAAQGKRIETEAAPIRYVAELLGIDTDSEKAIRWLIALMVLCCDPLAITLTAAASARRRFRPSAPSRIGRQAPAVLGQFPRKDRGSEAGLDSPTRGGPTPAAAARSRAENPLIRLLGRRR